MGVNIPDIELVIHWGVSTSILFYWQEVGRAGRDGRSAKAILDATARSLADKQSAPDMRSMCKDAAAGKCKAILDATARSLADKQSAPDMRSMYKDAAAGKCKAILDATARSLADKKSAPDMRSMCKDAAAGKCKAILDATARSLADKKSAPDMRSMCKDAAAGKCKAILDATARSLADKKSAPDMRSMCKDAAAGKCIRQAVLRHFVKPEHPQHESVMACGCSCCFNCRQHCTACKNWYADWGVWECFTNVLWSLQNKLPKIYNVRNNIYAANFKLKLCTCAQSIALDTRTKSQLEIVIRTILVIYKFRQNILESSRNVSERPTWSILLNLVYIYSKGMVGSWFLHGLKYGLKSQNVILTHWRFIQEGACLISQGQDATC